MRGNALAAVRMGLVQEGGRVPGLGYEFTAVRYMKKHGRWLIESESL